ncbi:4974_t:CDS:2, partial [Funneliformis caledonium]
EYCGNANEAVNQISNFIQSSRLKNININAVITDLASAYTTFDMLNKEDRNNDEELVNGLENYEENSDILHLLLGHCVNFTDSKEVK